MSLEGKTSKRISTYYLIGLERIAKDFSLAETARLLGMDLESAHKLLKREYTVVGFDIEPDGTKVALLERRLI